MLGEGEAEMSTFSRSLPAWMTSSRGRCSRPKPRHHSCLRNVLPQGNRRTSGEAFRLLQMRFCKGLQILAPDGNGIGVAERALNFDANEIKHSVWGIVKLTGG
jgi:hypothetical protein